MLTPESGLLPADARRLAALLIAAADEIEGCHYYQ